MKKNLVGIVLIAVAMFIGFRFGGGQITAQSQTAYSDEAAQQMVTENARAQQVYGNSMTAVVDGVPYTFQMNEAKVDNWSKQMQVKYVAYNPRGEVVYRITLSLDGNVAPGEYSSQQGNKELKIYLSDGIKTRAAFVGNALMSGQGSYHMSLNSRSADWCTYQGSFSAETTMSKGQEAVRIENANFSFTLGN